MVGRSSLLRLFGLVFREQKTRLQVDWLTHTDEQIIEYLRADAPEEPAAIAAEIDRSAEYVSDRCRQLAIRGLVARVSTEDTPTYALSDLGERYLDGEVDATELEALTD